ncbi:MAG: DUF7619 domain-containing protein [Bacteroidota bacterium]
MKKSFSLLIIIFFIAMNLIAQPTVQFTKTYGGAQSDYLNTVRQMPDNGYIIAGATRSFGHGNNDIYLVRTDVYGDTLWTNTFGGDDYDRTSWSMNNSLQITSDGGFIIVGETRSFGGSDSDVYMVKTDANGNLQWQKHFGGNSKDYANAVQQTSDGGYIITALSFSFADRYNDVWLIKTDSQGNLEWQKNYDMNGWEEPYCVRQTDDKGYLITGITHPNVFLMKTDSLGQEEWNKQLFGGMGYSFEPTTDGGYIVCGRTWTDAFLAKTNELGDTLWTKKYPGPGANFTYSVTETNDGGYMAVGETNASGSWDAYFIRTDEYGDTLWTHTMGGPGNEWLQSVQTTSDGGYATVGLTSSYGAGQNDGWLIKFKELRKKGFISGRIYRDNDDNCVYETGTDGILNGQMVKAEPGPYYVFTNSEGKYKFEVEPDQYTISPAKIPNALFDFQDCQDSTSYNFTVTAGGIVSDNDFALGLKDPPVCESNVNIVSSPFLQGPCTSPLSLSSPCPGYLHRYCFTITNTGTATIGPGSYVQVDLDPNMTFVEEVSNTCSGDLTVDFSDPTTPVWNVDNASVLNDNGDSCDVCFNVDVAFPISLSGYSSTANFNAICGNDYHVSGDVAEEDDACACDPNDKLVSPKGCGPYGNIARNESVTYHIRFQNIGTGPAHDIVIRDTIDTDFDISTLNILHSSHNITGLQVNPDNELVISFQGIELPDSVSDPQGSKGNVILELMPLSDLPNGTELKNRAAIYFDTNLPVLTNTTLNTVRDYPFPEADFTANRQCESIEDIYDFFYTGNTPDNASFYWDFGIDATPQFSTEKDPSGIIFSSTGLKEVGLTITRYGCTSSVTQTIEAVNVNCGKNNNKILVCHTPPGNPENPQTICISPNAVPAHLAHGDCVGPCLEIQPKSMMNEDNRRDIELFSAYPNPFKNSTMLSFILSEESHVLLQIYNCTGQKVATLFNNTAEAGKEYKAEFNTSDLDEGVYIAVLKSDKHNKVIKLSIVK